MAANHGLEANILAALLCDRDAIAVVGEVLSPRHFSDPKHNAIAEAIWSLFNRGGAIDILTVKQEVYRSGNFGFFRPDELSGYLSELTRQHTYGNLNADAHILIQQSIRLDVANLSFSILEQAHSETADAAALVSQYEEGLLDIVAEHIHTAPDLLNQLLPKAIAAIQKQDTTQATGHVALDTVLGGGVSPADLVIIAARPSTGKTAFALSLAMNLAATMRRVPVAVFSLEMSKTQLTNRMLAADTGIELEKFRSGDLNTADWQRLVNSDLASAPIYIDDTPALSIYQIRTRVRRMIAELGIGAVVVDYLQLIGGSGRTAKNQTREQEVSHVSRMLKVIAKEFNVPVFALSQLNRSVETRSGDKRPQLSDLRESGSIEQDADMVWFLYRPELYGIDFDDDGLPTRNTIEVIVAKHRNGNPGTARLKFNPANMRFSGL